MTPTTTPHDPALELTLLQLLRFKGRVRPSDLTASLARDESVCAELLDTAVRRGYCVTAGAGVRLTPSGRTHLAELTDAERTNVDGETLGGLYDEFREHNATLKAVVTAWQMRDTGVVNDHSDPAYDAGVVDRLRRLHDDFAGLLDRIVRTAPRLTHYSARFGHAVDRVLAGDTSYVARPVLDSYHTVWFELHEELIGLLGLSRDREETTGSAW